MCAPELRAFEVDSMGVLAATPDGSVHASAKASTMAAPLNAETPLRTAAAWGISATLGERFADCVEFADILTAAAAVLSSSSALISSFLDRGFLCPPPAPQAGTLTRWLASRCFVKIELLLDQI
jgi:hypothetical protein